tara:strand:- start:3322 stop:3516 length:195 start_codon:yes stop_codon:yes gene_type:complete
MSLLKHKGLNKMKKIGVSTYEYKGYIVNGYEASTGLDWRIELNNERIISLPLKRDCKKWIDERG